MKNKLLFFFLMILAACQTSYEEPEISISDYRLEPGFALEVICSEPLLKAPVAMDFDSGGRIWVAEMPSYMSNMEGNGEKEATGSIKILEDLDRDGVMDHAKPFLDSLVLPRAIALVYGGLLYAEPPNLWFVEIEDDKPVNRTLVDSLYAADGNPEHQPNGLVLNVDNWIYNAKSNFRYRYQKGTWLKEPTTFRGQWGISHDNFGRLYYNDNSRQLIGDHVLPNRLIRNAHHIPKSGVNRLLTDDQRVYPLHATLVNRGYAKGVLDQDSLLVNVTAACGPLIYRGSGFPSGYDQNAFVCVPEANLIKRNLLTFHGDSTSARQAWTDREFLASTDEGFRPVSLSNGPDGALYIVDMHRGVLGHHAYLSPYFKKRAKREQLDTIVDFGRVLRVTHADATLNEVPDFESLSEHPLLELLKHPNGWIRDRAQHHLIYRGQTGAIPELEELSLEIQEPLAQIHALYALEGLEGLSFSLLEKVAGKSGPDVIAHALVLMEKFISPENTAAAKHLFENLLAKNDTAIDLYLGSTVGMWANVSNRDFLPILYNLAKRHGDNAIVTDGILSGISESSEAVMEGLKALPQFQGSHLVTQISATHERKRLGTTNPVFTNKALAEDNRTSGAKIFRQICAACHGINGEGIDGLAPPLVKSEYVSKPIERLGLIILHGLTGPVHVNGKRYELNQAMPGLLGNESLSDKDIADVISYVTNAFSDYPTQLKAENIQELRTVTSKSGSEFTEEELMAYPKKTP